MDLSSEIKSWAREIGFDQVGLTSFTGLEEGEQRLQEWIQEGRHGSMKYLEDFRERRADLPDPDQLIQVIRGLLPVLKATKIAELVGINPHTFASKVRRGGPFTDGERSRLSQTLHPYISSVAGWGDSRSLSPDLKVRQGRTNRTSIVRHVGSSQGRATSSRVIKKQAQRKVHLSS